MTVIYFLSLVFSGVVFEERKLSVNPLTVFILLCPMINTIYCLIRIKHLKHLLPSFESGWLKDTLKNL